MRDHDTDRGHGPHWEHSIPIGANGLRDHQAPAIKCVRCEGWASDIISIAATLLRWADWPGSDDAHDDVGRLIDGLKSIVALAEATDITPVGYHIEEAVALLRSQMPVPLAAV